VNEVFYILTGLFLGLLVGLLLKRISSSSKIKEAEEKAKRIVSDALKEAETKRKRQYWKQKTCFIRQGPDFERETKESKAELANLEKRFLLREENLERKIDLLDKKEAEITRKEKELLSKDKALDEKIEFYSKGLKEQREMLEKIAKMSSEDAKKQLM